MFWNETQAVSTHIHNIPKQSLLDVKKYDHQRRIVYNSLKHTSNKFTTTFLVDHFMCYSFLLAARDLLYAPYHRQDRTYSMGFSTSIVEYWLEQEIAQWVSSNSTEWRASKSVWSWCDGLSDRSFMVDPLSYFSFQPVPHDCCNKGCGMCYPVCGMMHIKESERVAYVAAAGFLSPYLSGSDAI